MALAKVYDTEDTLMVPMDLDATEGLPALLYATANLTQPVIGDRLRDLADAISDARISAGFKG